jgi:hypothetical protein
VWQLNIIPLEKPAFRIAAVRNPASQIADHGTYSYETQQ